MTGKKKSYEVGYGKPPKSTRFRKGNSGNPKGRPKGKRITGAHWSGPRFFGLG